MPPSASHKNVDEGLEKVGALGRLQAGLMAVNIVSNFLYVWADQSIIFIGATPNYYCDSTSGIDHLEEFNDTHTCNGVDECDGGWEYDNSSYERTIVTQWDLVCARNGFVETAQGMLMLGGAFGGLLTGFLANHVGRRPVILGSLLIAVTSGLSLIFSPGIIAFTVLFAVYGAAQPGYYSPCHVLLLEYLTPRDRGRLGSWPPFFHSIGTIVLGGVAYFLGDWRHLQATLMSPYIFMLVAVLIIYTMVHIGVVLNTNKLAAGNPHLKVVLGGLLEIPGRLFPVVLTKRLGSRFIAVYFFFLSGIALVFVVVFHEETSYGGGFGSVAVIISLLCRMLITVCVTPCLLLTMELFPTTVRTFGTGLAQFSARFGGFLATVLLYLDNVFFGFSMTTMAVCCVVASLLCYSLPDTTNEPQPETPEDLEILMAKRRTLLPSRTPVVTVDEGTKDEA